MFLLIDGSSLLTTNFMGNLPPEIKFCKDDDKYDDMQTKFCIHQMEYIQMVCIQHSWTL